MCRWCAGSERRSLGICFSKGAVAGRVATTGHLVGWRGCAWGCGSLWRVVGDSGRGRLVSEQCKTILG